MALFESYERRIDKINGVLAQYGIGSVEECREMRESCTGTCSGSLIFVKRSTTNAKAKMPKAINIAGAASAIPVSLVTSPINAPIMM